MLRKALGWSAEPGQSFLRWLFLEPGARRRLSNWADFAAPAVASLRYEVGRHPDDRELTELVADLREGDPLVGTWWDDQRVTFRTSVTKHIEHPVAGPLVFGIESVVGPHDPDQRLVVYTVEPGSPTSQVMGLLTSWATDVAARIRRFGAPSKDCPGTAPPRVESPWPAGTTHGQRPARTHVRCTAP